MPTEYEYTDAEEVERLRNVLAYVVRCLEAGTPQHALVAARSEAVRSKTRWVSTEYMDSLVQSRNAFRERVLVKVFHDEDLKKHEQEFLELVLQRGPTGERSYLG